jgi:hypothetical protein
LDAAVTFANIGLIISGADNGVTLSDVGIYNLAGTLVADIGAQTGVLTTDVLFATVQGSITLPAGSYIFAATANSNTGGFSFDVVNPQAIHDTYTTVTSSVGGQLPTTITVVTTANSTPATSQPQGFVGILRT